MLEKSTSAVQEVRNESGTRRVIADFEKAEEESRPKTGSGLQNFWTFEFGTDC